MLNGKFFTGLPPKMIDRRSDGVRNRLESHLFWPDDTHVDTAVESRIKRRNSVQLACTERPLYQKQNSVVDNDVDTKKRFTREFSQSSIQFYDNLNENRDNSKRPMLRNSVANKKMDIAEKPTNTKLELPDSIVSDAYTAAKKKQAYTSKIEFYDYINEREEPQDSRNNLRKPKMDMNDKREMELNSKNSPKLQVKRDVRSLSEEKEQRKINNRDVRAIARTTSDNMNDIYNERERFVTNEDNYLRSRRSVEPRTNLSPRRGLAKTANNREKDIYRETESPPYERRMPASYENFEESGGFSPREYENLDANSFYSCKREQSKRMIRNNNRQYYDTPDDRDYSQKYQLDEEIENRMQNVHLKSPPPRKQLYIAEEYYDDEPQHYYGTPTNRGSIHQRVDYNDREVDESDLPYKNLKRENIDRQPVNKINNQIQHEPVASATSPSPSDAESSVGATKPQKHLRSSLSFNNGEIIGDNDAPTSSHYPAQRRNARSSATQRVSVGLPD